MLSAVLSPPSSHVVSISPAEVGAGRPLPSTAERAADVLADLGYVVLKKAGSSGLIESSLIESASDHATDDLHKLLSRLRGVGVDPAADSFSFNEVVHRSRARYDCKLDLRRTPPSAPWEALSEAVGAWTTPVFSAAAGDESLEQAVEGVITSLPGAPAQRFHSDGQEDSCFNCFVPLVDVGAQGTGTEFWPASHRDSSAAAEAKALLEEDPLVELPSHREVSQPYLSAGELLLYDYRVIHRGPANPSDGAARPVFYSAWASTHGRGDGYNFPQRSLDELERRQRLLGV